MRRTLLAMASVWLTLSPLADVRAQVDRAVAWTTAGEGGLERELNAHAARGLRVAAVSDGLPCTVTALQAPEKASPPVSYRVVADRDLAAAIGTLTADGFAPRLAHRRVAGRAHVIFERGGADRPATWRLIEFADLDALQPAIATAAADGFQVRILVRYPLKSWPGLSEKGLILASKREGGKAREVQVVVGQSSRIETAAQAVADAAAKGFGFDLLFTGSRDGSANARRERLLVLLSRETGAAGTPVPVKLERSTSFGTFGSGVPLGVVPFWDDSYVYAWSPAPRRQTWASPIRLSANESTCAGLSLKLRIDAPHDQISSIVALAARRLPTGGYELVYVTDQRMGPAADRERTLEQRVR